ncbi:neuronal acetylcholine receptor subunit alpha-7-like [Ylistrum balloti]|uniref:neuronal acetylcholine receptor subunit alpha-7-like n=1 Tax=Ylistrum balloti TaxID=509963 RepID=UPI0029058C2F|nr:neuronal acetylcholine receptor subunit alpha-7-like [Ylistrum balloti]
MTFFLFLLSAYLTTIYGATHVDLKRLNQNLMSNYSKHLRPTFNLSQPTELDVIFHVSSIKEFEEKTSRFSMFGVFMIYWHDFQLEWNPDDYGGIVSTVFPQSSLWKPDLLLLNPYEKVEPAGFDDLKIIVNYNGSVYWSPANVYEVTCPADVTYYPFDQQTCPLYFGVYMYTIFDVTLKPLSSGITTIYYFPNSVWHLVNVSSSIHPSLDTEILILTIVLQRRSMFQVINTIVPFSMLGLLNIMVFLLPAESGERVGFSVTILLAIAVFMTIVADTLPGTSEPSFPRLCYLLIAELFINTLVTISTILLLRLHHKPKQQTIPTWLQYLICFCFKTKNKTQPIEEDIQGISNEDNFIIKTIVPKVQETKTDKGVRKDSDLNGDDTINGKCPICRGKKYVCNESSWQTLASFLDIFFFLLFLVFFVSCKVVAYFVYI